MRHDRPTPWWGWLLIAALLPIFALFVALYALPRVLLQFIVWCVWGLQNRRVLFVYSASPIWQEYVEREILPRLGERAVVLNWSERKRWRNSLAVILFKAFGGTREFNPMAIVFRPFRWARCFRFHEPFRAFKHGRPEAVEAMAKELFQLLDV